ncbi:hypothetical protein WJX84_007961 [Apatococcus fuscideae]|uniref:Uncharacterized protein n=1 Tax=Apatococcus fuscideae TaxID=2026836 RepID=A0AAW1SS61_9CHLO
MVLSELRIGSLQARNIKGLEVAKASLRIAGSIDDVRVTTLPEVLALVKFRGVAFTSRHPRTPMKQFWRPSAWADAWCVSSSSESTLKFGVARR